MLESDIQRIIINTLKLKNCLVFRMNAGRLKNNVKLCPAGTPDLFVVSKDGFSFWVEVKTEKGELRESQKDMINELVNRGQYVIIARSIKEVEKALSGRVTQSVRVPV